MSAMIATKPADLQSTVEPIETTLLELVQVLHELTHDDREIVATVISLIDDGKVRLTGNFAGQRLRVD